MTNTLEKSGPTPKWAEDILLFWFGELTREDWFSGDASVDERISERFATLYEEKSTGIPEEALQDARAALAVILLFDQMPRNLFRGSAKAFATDEMALTIARHALDKGFEAQLTEPERAFLYMPFEHSENLADGERCVSLFKSLGDEEMIRYAVEHRDILARFGRYPHRNCVLNRESTAAEQAFLAEHAGFGQ